MITLKSFCALPNLAVLAIALAPPTLLLKSRELAAKPKPEAGCSAALPSCALCITNTCTAPPGANCVTTNTYVRASCIDWDGVYPGHCATVSGFEQHCWWGTDDEEICDTVGCCSGTTNYPYVACSSARSCP